jgi:hypothetical protein
VLGLAGPRGTKPSLLPSYKSNIADTPVQHLGGHRQTETSQDNSAVATMSIANRGLSLGKSVPARLLFGPDLPTCLSLQATAKECDDHPERLNSQVCYIQDASANAEIEYIFPVF